MKKIKFTLGLLVIVFISLTVYQNRVYFFTTQTLSLILVPEKFQWTAPAVQNVAYFGGCFIIGLVISGYFGLVSKWRSRKTIKLLNKSVLSHTETIESLKAELETLKQEQCIQENADNNTSSSNDFLSDSEPLLVEEVEDNLQGNLDDHSKQNMTIQNKI